MERGLTIEEEANLIDEQDTGDEFGDALLDVAIDDFVDLLSEFIGDLRAPPFDELANDREHVLPSLRPGIGHIEIMQCQSLNELLFLMDFSLGQGNILVCLEIELSRIRIRSTDPL